MKEVEKHYGLRPGSLWVEHWQIQQASGCSGSFELFCRGVTKQATLRKVIKQ